MLINALRLFAVLTLAFLLPGTMIFQGVLSRAWGNGSLLAFCILGRAVQLAVIPIRPGKVYYQVMVSPHELAR